MPEDYEKFLAESETQTKAAKEVRPFSHEEMVTCTECLRANPPIRFNCFYCGTKLPQSDAASQLRHPTLRQPEKWEEGFNLIFYGAASITNELIAEVAGLVGLESDAASRILNEGVPLPLARTHSIEEARLVEERLKERGLNIRLVSDTDLMMRDERRRRVRAFDFNQDALVGYAAGSAEVWHAEWQELSLMVTGRQIVRKVEMEERRKHSGSEIVEARELLASDVLLLDFYTNAEEGAWRVASDSFDFSCLGDRKGLIAAQNFATLVEVLREHAPQAVLDDSYNSLRQALAPVWPPEERTESGGLRRERPGRLNREAVMTSDNEQQFTLYSRLRHFQMLGQQKNFGQK